MLSGGGTRLFCSGVRPGTPGIIVVLFFFVGPGGIHSSQRRVVEQLVEKTREFVAY